MKIDKKQKKIIVVVAIVITGIILSSYGLANLITTPPKTYTLTIYLNETEAYESQMEEIGTLLHNYYIQKLNGSSKSVVFPTISWDVNKPPYVTTQTWDPYLEDILQLLESHGYRVTYAEE